MNELREAEVFKALSSPTRLEIMKLLSGRSLCVGAIAASLKVTQPAVSQHLGILKNAGLVVPRKEGYRVHYNINNNGLKETAELLNILSGKNTISSFEQDAGPKKNISHHNRNSSKKI